jgi:hypothetical protein
VSFAEARAYLQLLQLLAEQPLQSPPPEDETNFPPLFTPKSENFRFTFRPRHSGQLTRDRAEATIFSNSSPQREQTYSKRGMDFVSSPDIS